LHSAAEEATHAIEQVGVPVPQKAEQTGRILDIGKKEGDLTAWQTAHHPSARPGLAL
jgi:hypothetical protein